VQSCRFQFHSSECSALIGWFQFQTAVSISVPISHIASASIGAQDDTQIREAFHILNLKPITLKALLLGCRCFCIVIHEVEPQYHTFDNVTNTSASHHQIDLQLCD